MVWLLLDNGGAVDVKGKDGRTALMYAILQGHAEVVRLLLGKGGAVDVKGKDGRTALMYAILVQGRKTWSFIGTTTTGSSLVHCKLYWEPACAALRLGSDARLN